ncbi:RNA polymerase-binding protein DksA [Halochromatium salexigens]|uniref:RNA polymerase-binding transcription factor DksA n=1 Tax=Halochromatium salexigens TaxID=49447 RepID=A0AAJ0UFD3_HALSE|nr:RNA polymerase-binding protein DksA [Halochromatium salexigens]MBK5930432.1 RNA polymerase-binding protein DksA [Halochromatium salexigens]
MAPNDAQSIADEDYMSPRQLAYFRQKLLNWREALLNEAQATIDQLRDDSHRDVGDEIDRASREASQALELRTRDRYRKLVIKIDEALARINDGSYGYCEETGEPIGLARLQARPIATLSVEAQERRELRERQANLNY